MKKSDQVPFQSPPDYGKSLRGLSVNLLSADLARSRIFQRQVLGVDLLHDDHDLLIVEAYGSQWMVHADHTYDKHPLLADTREHKRRGAGIELRVHGCDPDQAARQAESLGFTVLDPPRDQPDHGLREAHIIDDDGYVWVPDIKLAD